MADLLVWIVDYEVFGEDPDAAGVITTDKEAMHLLIKIVVREAHR